MKTKTHAGNSRSNLFLCFFFQIERKQHQGESTDSWNFKWKHSLVINFNRLKQTYRLQKNDIVFAVERTMTFTDKGGMMCAIEDIRKTYNRNANSSPDFVLSVEE